MDSHKRYREEMYSAELITFGWPEEAEEYINHINQTKQFEHV